jgi:hypothetical protein
MLPADYPFELKPRKRSRWKVRGLRVFAVWLSVTIHAVLLIRLLAPAEPLPPPPRLFTVQSDVMQVFLLDTATPAAPAIAAQTELVRAVESAPTSSRQTPTRPIEPVDDVSEPAKKTIGAAQLFGSIEGVAGDIVGVDPRLAGAGMPSALARLPGSSEAIIDLPVRFKRRPTPQEVSMFALRIIVATMASNGDDLESARTMRNPLLDLTDAHMHNIKEPECNDPEDPLRDPRCAKPPRR